MAEGKINKPLQSYGENIVLNMFPTTIPNDWPSTNNGVSNSSVGLSGFSATIGFAPLGIIFTLTKASSSTAASSYTITAKNITRNISVTTEITSPSTNKIQVLVPVQGNYVLDMFELSVSYNGNTKTVTYGIMTYMSRASIGNSTSTVLRGVARAVYLYGYWVKEYLG